MLLLTKLLLLAATSLFALAQVNVDNSLAELEIINKPKADKYIR